MIYLFHGNDRIDFLQRPFLPFFYDGQDFIRDPADIGNLKVFHFAFSGGDDFRYFGISWSNQTLAMIALWTASMYLFKNKKLFWVTALPATFMTAVSVTYFFYAPECLNLGTKVAYPIGLIAAAACLILFLSKSVFKKDGAKA